jgi:long-chain acyl-CoA synthetase
MQDFTRLFDILPYQRHQYPQSDCLSYKYGNKWKQFSTDEVIEFVNRASRAFLALGLKPGDKVAIISNNRPEWNIIDNGMMQAGLINVPVYPTISEADYKFIFNQAEIKMAFVSSDELFEKISHIKSEVPTLEGIYSFEKVEGCDHYEDFLSKAEDKFQEEVDKISASIKPDELATIIYTSGTTGLPKGVMLSHDNVVSNIKNVIPCLPLNQSHRCLSFLPLCHIFERVVTYTYFATGASIYYAESLETISENLKEVKPHFFSSVPRLLEKVYDKIVGKGLELTGIKKKLFFWALDLALEYQPGYEQKFKYKIADRLIFSKWREALGGEVIGIVTGAAALQERLARVFSAAGIAIREGYGQTETSPVISVNRFEPGQFKFGTVGTIIPSVTVKFMDMEGNVSERGPGEIIIQGPNVMMGYYKNEEATNDTIKNGWLHTGDVGEMDGPFLKITDRIKALFKTSGGKYVAPQVVEEKLKESRYIEQVCVLGENQKFVSALIVPAVDNIRDWLAHKGLSAGSAAELVAMDEVKSLIQKEVDRLNENFGQVEKVKKFELLADEWTIDGGEMTPTMKVKRKVIIEKYAANIEGLYEN